MTARPVALSLAAIALLVGAGIPTGGVRGAPPPTLSILSPRDGTVIGDGGPVAVVFNVTDFNLTDPGTGPSSPNSGHVDVHVDGNWTTTASVNTVVLRLASGPHTIRLRLVMDNGSALTPDVAASVSVVVTRGPAGGTPAISIAYPQEGALLGTDFTVSFRATNFAIVPLDGIAGVPHEGHLQVWLDGAAYAVWTDYAPLHFNAPDGPHTITVQLVDPSGLPLQPDVRATVNVTAKALTGRIIPFDATPYFGAANVLLGLAILAALYRKLEVRE